MSSYPLSLFRVEQIWWVLHLGGSKTSRHHSDLGNLAYTVACLHDEVCTLHLDFKNTIIMLYYYVDGNFLAVQ